MSTLYGDRWRIKDNLGEGGQAHTYLVTDAMSGKKDLSVLKRQICREQDKSSGMMVIDNEGRNFEVLLANFPKHPIASRCDAP